MNISKRAIAGMAAAPVLVLGAAIPALAQDATATEEAASETPEERRAERTTELAAALAEELGLDTETVAAALETVRTELAEQRQAEMRAALQERLDAAVADGSLTQEQADAILAASEAGVLGGTGGFGGGPGRGHGGFGGGFGGPGFAPPADAEVPSESASATSA